MIRASGFLVSRRSVLSGLGLSAVAQGAKAASPPDKPFSEHRLVLQLSDRGDAKEALVLSVAFNLLEIYGPDRISIEIVVFGPGIDLLRRDNPKTQLVDSLISQGVIFDACMNTIDTLQRDTGETFPLNPKAQPIKAGVAQILSLTEAGYTLVKP